MTQEQPVSIKALLRDRLNASSDFFKGHGSGANWDAWAELYSKLNIDTFSGPLTTANALLAINTQCGIDGELATNLLAYASFMRYIHFDVPTQLWYYRNSAPVFVRSTAAAEITLPRRKKKSYRTCSTCGSTTHNKGSCPHNLDKLPIKVHICGNCGKPGHNRRTCPEPRG